MIFSVSTGGSKTIKAESIVEFQLNPSQTIIPLHKEALKIEINTVVFYMDCNAMEDRVSLSP